MTSIAPRPLSQYSTIVAITTCKANAAPTMRRVDRFSIAGERKCNREDCGDPGNTDEIGHGAPGLFLFFDPASLPHRGRLAGQNLVNYRDGWRCPISQTDSVEQLFLRRRCIVLRRGMYDSQWSLSIKFGTNRRDVAEADRQIELFANDVRGRRPIR